MAEVKATEEEDPGGDTTTLEDVEAVVVEEMAKERVTLAEKIRGKPSLQS